MVKSHGSKINEKSTTYPLSPSEERQERHHTKATSRLGSIRTENGEICFAKTPHDETCEACSASGRHEAIYLHSCLKATIKSVAFFLLVIV